MIMSSALPAQQKGEWEHLSARCGRRPAGMGRDTRPSVRAGGLLQAGRGIQDLITLPAKTFRVLARIFDVPICGRKSEFERFKLTRSIHEQSCAGRPPQVPPSKRTFGSAKKIAHFGIGIKRRSRPKSSAVRSWHQVFAASMAGSRRRRWRASLADNCRSRS